MPPDQGMLQMMALMGGNMGQVIPEMNAMGAVPQSANRQPNIGSYLRNSIIRKDIRTGMQGPQGIRGTGTRGGGNGAYSPSGMPNFGASGFDPSSVADPGMMNQTLQPYGLQLPTHTNPFLFFNDQHPDGSPTWASNHPKVAKAIEGGLIGATVGPSATPGEAISNIARTVLGMPGMYSQHQAAQMMAPFQMAQEMGAVQEQTQRMQLQQAQVDHLGAQSEALQNPRDKFQPFFVPGQGVLGFNPTDNTYSPSTSSIPMDPNTAPQRLAGPQKAVDPNKLPSYVKTSQERAAFFEYQSTGGEFDEKGAPKDSMRFNKLVDRYTAKRQPTLSGAPTRTPPGYVPDDKKLAVSALKDAAHAAQMEYEKAPYGKDAPARKAKMEQTRRAYMDAATGTKTMDLNVAPNDPAGILK